MDPGGLIVEAGPFDPYLTTVSTAESEFITGSASYFRGIGRTGRYFARRYGFMGESEKIRAQLENKIFAEFMHQLLSNPRFQRLALDLAIEYACENKARIAGRAGTGFLVSATLTKVAGGPGTALGFGLNVAAIHGDIRYGIESGLRSAESFILQGIGGHLR